MKFATKPIQHHPPHLRHVATLPWEIKKFTFYANIQQTWKQMQTSWIFVASDFAIDPQIVIFSVFNIESFSPY